MPTTLSLVDDFLRTLHALPASANVFNPWVDVEARCKEIGSAAEARTSNLTAYLRDRVQSAQVVLIAEAPSCKGAKFSGVAMTSERIALGHGPGALKGVQLPQFRMTSAPDKWPRGRAEQTATLVWSRLIDLGYAPTEFVLWNAYPCHPHEANSRFTNRTPTRSELRSAAHVLQQFLGLFSGRKVVAVGNVAHEALGEMNVDVPYVRHPANGGASDFQCAIRNVVPARSRG